MRDADAQPIVIRRARRFESRAELLKRLLAAADTLERNNLAFADRQDRLDVQQIAGEGRRATDATALGEELERIDREDQAGVAAEALYEPIDLLVRRASFEPALDR